MILRQYQKFQLWSGCHPLSVGCIAEGRDQCRCQYHVVDEARTQSIGFDTWQEAEAKFRELSGAGTLRDEIIKY